MRVIKYIILCLVFLSCVTSKKAHKYFNEHSKEFAQDCGNAFPLKDSVIVRDSVSIDTVLIPNEEWWKLDTITVYQQGDSIHVPCPPLKIITRTIKHDSLIIVENTAKVSFLESQLKMRDESNAVLKDNLQKTIVDRNSWRSKSRKNFWWLIAIVAALLGYGFRKPIAEFIGTIIKVG